jgi:hypothetical protein
MMGYPTSLAGFRYSSSTQPSCHLLLLAYLA